MPDWSKPIILLLAAVAAGLGLRSALVAKRARRLAAESALLARDVELLQSALVPDLPPQLGALAISAAYRPAEGPAAGGDFYDAFEVGEGRVAIVLGDTSGHGRAAVSRAVSMRYTLRAYVEAGLDPRSTLKLAGSVLAQEEGEDEFTTVAVGIYDPGTGGLTYATAGHPPPILLGTPVAEPVTACASPPIGWGVPTGRRQTTVSLPAGAVACFFTDGLTEARRGDGMLGRGRVAALLRALGPRPLATTLLERVREESDDGPDDMAACTLEARLGDSEPAVQIEELEVDEQELDGPRVPRFLEACGCAPAETGRVIAVAGPIAAEFGAALVRVDLGGDEPAVTATPLEVFDAAASPGAAVRLAAARS